MEDFDAMASGFDTDRRVNRAVAIAGEIRSRLVDGRRKSAIEYGCGTGLVGMRLLDDLGSVLFVDSSPAMIQQVRRKLRQSNNLNGASRCCDFLLDLPHGLNADYIFTSLVLHHIADTEAILSRFYALLREGGHLLAVDLDLEDGSFHAKYPDFDGHNGFDQKALMRMATIAGFKSAHCDTFYHGKKTVGGKEAPYSLFILDAEK